MVGAIIQARMGSSRLPGKTMHMVNDKPLLQYCVERVKQARYVDKVIIATTENSADDEIYKWCIENNISCYRGNEQDVLDRYYQAAIVNNLDIIVRVTSDCPFIEPSLIDMLITTLINYDYDYTSNRWKTRSWPHGLDAEVFKREALYKAWEEADKAYEREHVTPYILEHDDMFNLAEIPLNKDLSYIRLTVDYQEDMTLVKAIMSILQQRWGNTFSWHNIIEVLEEDENLGNINKSAIDVKLY